MFRKIDMKLEENITLSIYSSINYNYQSQNILYLCEKSIIGNWYLPNF